MSRITPEDLREEARKHFEIGSRLREAADALEKLGPQEIDGDEDDENETSSSSSSSSDTFLNRTRIEAVEEVLREAREPLAKEEIQRRTAAKGFPIRGDTLSSYLSRDRRFYSVGGRGYWGIAELMGQYKEEK